jgi:hypothetical protein
MSGDKLSKIGTAITYLFGAMGIFSGLIGIIVGCLYTKAEKCSKICGCFVSKSIINALGEANSGNFEGLLMQ